MVQSIITFVILVIIFAALAFVAFYLKQKYADWREFRGKVLDINNHVMIINTLEPGMWSVILVEDEETGRTVSFTTNLSPLNELVIGKTYTFVTCNDKLVDVKATE